MARCGCNTAMSTTCDAIMSCVAANLGRGLDYNEVTGEIELRISTDAGNVAEIGSDDGFYAPGGTGPGPMEWLKTVATLPEQVISAASASNLVGPATIAEMIEYSIANGVDMYAAPVFALADGTVYEGVGAPTSSVTVYTDNPGGIQNRLLSSLTLKQLYYDAGTRVSPTSRNSNAPVSMLTPDGGWGGFHAPEPGLRDVSETLRQVRGRMVVSLGPQRLGLAIDEIERGIQSTIDAVVQAGAQEWVLILIPVQLADDSRAPLDEWVGMVTDAGIAAGANAFSEGAMSDPFTAAEIVASGATWVHVNSPGRPGSTTTDARVTELVTAGLEVVVSTSARQYWTTYLFGLGARAVQSADAVYARGSRGEAGDLAYRTPFIPGLSTRTSAVGALTSVTDSNTSMWQAGFARADLPGRWFPERYGWSGSTPRLRNAQLLGTIDPIPDADNYVVRLRVRREAFTSGTDDRSVGLFLCAPDDRDASHLSGGAVKPYANGYEVLLHSRSTGRRMGISRVLNGSGNFGVGVTTGATAYVADTWITMTVTVSPTELTLTSSTNTATVTYTEATWRGGYVFYTWDDQLGTMVHGYDNPDDLVMYESTS